MRRETGWGVCALMLAACGGDGDPDQEQMQVDAAPPLTGVCVDLDMHFEALRAGFEADLAANRVPGGALAVVCGGHVRTAGVGVVKKGGEELVTPATRFQLASITKTLT